MNKSDSVLENKTYKILWDLEIQIKLKILTWRSNLALLNKEKRTWRRVDFGVQANHSENKRE